MSRRRLLSRCFCLLILLGLWSCKPAEQTVQGYIQSDNLYLASPYSGILKKRPVDRGQPVTKNQVLFQIDPDKEQFQVEASQASLRQALHLLKDLEEPKRKPEIEAIKAQIAQAVANQQLTQIRLKRQQTLYQKGAVNQDTVDAAVADYKRADESVKELTDNLALAELGAREEQIKAQHAAVETSRAQLAISRWELAQKAIQSPAAGRVLDTYFEEGEFVPAQQPVVSLITPETVHVEFFISTAMLAQLKLGQTIYFSTDVPGSSRNKAVISFFAPQAEFMPPLVYSRENNANLVFRVQATFSAFNQYKPGQPVTVYLP